MVIIKLWLRKFPLELATLFAVFDACIAATSSAKATFLAVLFDISSCVSLIESERHVFTGVLPLF